MNKTVYVLLEIWKWLAISYLLLVVGMIVYVLICWVLKEPRQSIMLLWALAALSYGVLRFTIKLR
jgi:hypothetical protein